MRLAVVLLILLFANKGFPQNWTGSDNFNSSVLDTNKWIMYESIDGNLVSANLVKSLTGISFFSPDNTTYERWGLIFYSKKLPLNESWSATVEASIDENYTSPTKGVEAMMAVMSTVSTQTNDLVTIGLDKNTNSRIGWNYQRFKDVTINHLIEEDSINISSGHVVLKLDFNTTTKNITASYSDARNPDIFIPVKTFSTLNWQNLTNFNLCIGGYSVFSAINSNQLVMDNFRVNRTSTNAYNTMLLLQESYDLFNWSVISTNYLYKNDPKAFYRLQIQKQ